MLLDTHAAIWIMGSSDRRDEMTANQAIREAAEFNRYGCHVDTLEDMLMSMGSEKMARVSMDDARRLLDLGERETAILYLNRAEWALQ